MGCSLKREQEMIYLKYLKYLKYLMPTRISDIPLPWDKVMSSTGEKVYLKRKPLSCFHQAVNWNFVNWIMTLIYFYFETI